MAAMVWLTVGTTVGVVSPLLYWRWRVAARAKQAEEICDSGENAYAAVSIIPGLIACEAVAEAAGKRFLEAEAPELPVAGCNEDQCQCRYRYFDDRRSGDSRRDPIAPRDPFGTMAIDAKKADGDERRTGRDRRRSTEKARPRAYFNDYQH